MSYIAQSTIQEVNDRIDAIAVVGEYVRLEKRGGRYLGLCPFHQEKTPSFTVNPDLKLYHCFGCGQGGTVLHLVMEMEKLSFPEAIELLAKRWGIPIVYEHTGSGQDPGAFSRIQELEEKEKKIELYTRVAGSFHYLLMERPEGSAAKGYALSRGLLPETLDRFRLGYAPADRRWLFWFLSHKGYSAPFLAASKLFSSRYPQYSFFSDRLMFPIADRLGKTIAFGGRLLSGDGPKYLNSPESEIYKKGHTLFALDQALGEIRKTREVYLAEGYLDVIALHQAGIATAVAPLGTAFTDEQAQLLRRWAERVYIFFDSDAAGQQATLKAILTCRRNGLVAAVVISPLDGNVKDPADILKEAGPERLQKTAKNGILDLEYLIIRSKSLFDLSGSEGKAKACAFMFPYLETLDSEVSRMASIEQVADALGVDRMAVLHDYTSHIDSRERPVSRRGREEEYPQPAMPIRMNDELYLLIVVAVTYRLYPKLRASLLIKEIEDPLAKELFIALEECFLYDESGMDALLFRISRADLRNFVTKHAASREFASNPEQLLSDGIKRIKQRCLEKRLCEIILELRIVESGTTGMQPEELLAEKMHIDAELRRMKEDKQ
ncbi:MAG: DNA primase [Treponema sp.]|jgi:DNA primase|nr:DNA primase [Treponema sp.]